MAAALLYSFLLAFLVAVASGKNIHASLNLTWGVGAPDGNQREMVFINGQFPGPQLNLTQGDSIEVCALRLNRGLQAD